LCAKLKEVFLKSLLDRDVISSDLLEVILSDFLMALYAPGHEKCYIYTKRRLLTLADKSNNNAHQFIKEVSSNILLVCTRRGERCNFVVVSMVVVLVVVVFVSRSGTLLILALRVNASEFAPMAWRGSGRG
jgi:hypothetical protein